jgi:hypothetical protein
MLLLLPQKQRAAHAPEAEDVMEAERLVVCEARIRGGSPGICAFATSTGIWLHSNVCNEGKAHSLQLRFRVGALLVWSSPAQIEKRNTRRNSDCSTGSKSGRGTTEGEKSPENHEEENV